MTQIRFSSKKLAASVLALTVACVCIVLMYSTVQDWSHDKTVPYRLSVTIAAAPESRVFIGYDYGYGIQDQHIRPLDIAAEHATLEFSLSAWKPISALYFIAPKSTPYEVTALKLAKNGVDFQPELPTSGPILEGDNLLYRLSLSEFDY